MSRKTALVTGSSHGIGKAIAIELSKKGYDVGINYCSNKKGAEDTLSQIEALGRQALIIRADVSKYEELTELFDKFFQEFGSIDLMVNNAGISEFYPILEASEADWDRIMNTNCKAAYFGTQFAARKMVEDKKSGVIINITSNHVEGCFPNASIYAASKGAVDMFCRNAAMELAPHHIRVISLAPGYTDVWDADHPIHEIQQRIPLKRFAKPEEIAQIVAFLASDSCGYLTGTRLTVDGGALLPVVPENSWWED